VIRKQKEGKKSSLDIKNQFIIIYSHLIGMPGLITAFVGKTFLYFSKRKQRISLENQQREFSKPTEVGEK
jgi:hypothetical protein